MNSGPPCDERRQDVRRDLGVVVEDLVVYGQHETPAVTLAIPLGGPGGRWDKAGLVASFPVQVERVGIEDRWAATGIPEWDQPWLEIR